MIATTLNRSKLSKGRMMETRSAQFLHLSVDGCRPSSLFIAVVEMPRAVLKRTEVANLVTATPLRTSLAYAEVGPASGNEAATQPRAISLSALPLGDNAVATPSAEPEPTNGPRVAEEPLTLRNEVAITFR